jgi:hypothetical protein
MPRLDGLEERTVPSTLTVTNNLDTGVAGDGSLRGEIAAAQSGDTINFAPSLAGQTITLTHYGLEIDTNLDIEGLGADRLTITGTYTGSYYGGVFGIGSNASVTIAGLTISSGFVLVYGGGIYNGGTLTLNYCTLSGNQAEGGGGAVYNSGNLTINNSTLSGNGFTGIVGGWVEGGAVFMAGGSLTINSSTLTGNYAAGGSGASYSGGGYPAGNGLGGGLYLLGGAVTIDHSTIAGNGASGGPGPQFEGGNGYGYGGGIYSSAGTTLQVHDSIIADNSASDAGPDLYGSLTSLGYNLIGNSSGGSGFAASDLLNVNPQFGPLQNNGGPTRTMALLPGSPAVSAGDVTGAPAFDQRGFARIVGGTIDIGAFEVQSAGLATHLAVEAPASTPAGMPFAITVTALDDFSQPATGYTGTVHFVASNGAMADYTFTAADAGQHTFSGLVLQRAQTLTVTGTDTANALLTGSTTFTIAPAAASQFLISAPSSVSAGVAFRLTVTVLDAYGNVVTGYTGRIHFSSTDSSATLPADYTFRPAADQGVHTFGTGTDRLVLRNPGKQTITITDTLDSSLTASVIVDVL